MKRVLVAVLVAGSMGVGFAAGKSAAGKDVRLRSDQDSLVVPAGHIWKVEGLRPYEAEKGVGTSDFVVDGQIFVGKERDYNISGKFDVLVNKPQQFPIWILADSKVEVGDSRGEVTVKEYAED